MAAVIWRLPVFEELYSESMMAKQGWIRLVERRNYALFASEAVRALDSYDRRNRIISAQPSLSSSSLSRTTSTTTSSSSRVSSESKKTAATISILKLTEEKQQHRSEILQSWEDVAHKVIKALSELI
jgi:hypothetical protein